MKIVLLLIMWFTSIMIAQAQPNVIGPVAGFRLQPKELTHPSSKGYNALGELKWKFETKGKIVSSPLVAENKVVFGSEDHYVYAIDTKTGLETWRFATGGAVNSSPVLGENTVYVGSMDGHFYALDFTSGKQKWKLKTGGERRLGDTSYWGMKPAGVYMEDLWDCFISSPIVDGSTVYFGSSDGNLYAVNANTGMIQWKFKTHGSIHASPTLHNGIIYIGGWDAYLYAVDAKTGKEVWKFKTGDQPAMTGIQASVTVDDNILYFGARDAHLYALNATDGSVMWNYDARGSWIISTAVLHLGTLYVGTSDSYLLLAIDAGTGIEKFRFKTCGYVFGTPAVAGSTAYVGDFTGRMYAVDINAPEKQSSTFSTDARKQHASQVLKNDTLNFAHASKGADLYFYEANRKVMGEFYALGSIVSSPAIHNGVIYFGSADGYLYALNLGTAAGKVKIPK